LPLRNTLKQHKEKITHQGAEGRKKRCFLYPLRAFSVFAVHFSLISVITHIRETGIGKPVSNTRRCYGHILLKIKACAQIYPVIPRA
jgi:hypothetical protein